MLFESFHENGDCFAKEQRRVFLCDVKERILDLRICHTFDVVRILRIKKAGDVILLAWRGHDKLAQLAAMLRVLRWQIYSLMLNRSDANCRSCYLGQPQIYRARVPVHHWALPPSNVQGTDGGLLALSLKLLLSSTTSMTLMRFPS